MSVYSCLSLSGRLTLRTICDSSITPGPTIRGPLGWAWMGTSSCSPVYLGFGSEAKRPVAILAGKSVGEGNWEKKVSGVEKPHDERCKLDTAAVVDILCRIAQYGGVLWWERKDTRQVNEPGIETSPGGTDGPAVEEDPSRGRESRKFRRTHPYPTLLLHTPYGGPVYVLTAI